LLHYLVQVHYSSFLKLNLVTEFRRGNPTLSWYIKYMWNITN